jgi:hypothetical protein
MRLFVRAAIGMSVIIPFIGAGVLFSCLSACFLVVVVM